MPTTSPYSYVDFGTAGDLTSAQIGGTFNGVNLEVINTSDVYVVRTTSAGAKTTLTSSQFTVTESGSNINVVIATLSPAIAATDLIRIGRTTVIGETTRSFADGSVLKASDLNEQNKQLLFAVQETADGGVGSLPLDTDDKYDANGKVIKNLGTGSSGNDAVTKSYVDGIQLYGTGAGLPQSWNFTSAAGDVVGSHRNYVLSSPIPASTSGELYIIEVGGVVQTPDAYSITEVSDVYTLSLLNGASEIANSTDIHVRNFGISRHVLQQPLISTDASSTTFTVQKLTSQTANLQEWVDDASTPNVLASVDADGDASFRQIDASGIIAAAAGLNITGAVQSRDTASDSFSSLGVIHQIVRSDEITDSGRWVAIGSGGYKAYKGDEPTTNYPYGDDMHAVESPRTTGTWDGALRYITSLTITPKSSTSSILLIGKFRGLARRRDSGGSSNDSYQWVYEIFKDVTSDALFGKYITGTRVPTTAGASAIYRDEAESVTTTNTNDTTVPIFGFIPSDQLTKDQALTLTLGADSMVKSQRYQVFGVYTSRAEGFEWLAIEVG